jgi:hypothetical protein
MKVLFGCGIRGMHCYRSLVEVGVVEFIWGCCCREGGISGGDGGGLGVMLMVAVVLVGS